MTDKIKDIAAALNDDYDDATIISDEKYTPVEKTIAHPLEAILDIEPNTTIVPSVERVQGELVKSESYDEKDDEIDRNIQEVFDAAMTAFENAQNDENITQARGPAASPAEVGNMFLNTALNAMKVKSQVKMHKDKIEVAANKSSSPHTLNQNIIVADRNDMLKELMNKTKDED